MDTTALICELTSAMNALTLDDTLEPMLSPSSHARA